jgi:oligoribonuclease (3'-5' exoribonuclease)
MEKAELLGLAKIGNATEDQLIVIAQRWETSVSDEETLNLIEEVKAKYGANKGTAQTVKTTTSAAKAAEEAGVKLTEVAPAKGTIVTESDVEKAAEAK